MIPGCVTSHPRYSWDSLETVTIWIQGTWTSSGVGMGTIWLWLSVRHGKFHPFLSLVNHLFRLGPSIPWRTVSQHQRVRILQVGIYTWDVAVILLGIVIGICRGWTNALLMMYSWNHVILRYDGMVTELRNNGKIPYIYIKLDYRWLQTEKHWEHFGWIVG